MITKNTVLDLVSEYNIIMMFSPKNLGGQNTMFDPQVNFWGSFDPRDPTVPAPLAGTSST